MVDSHRRIGDPDFLEIPAYQLVERLEDDEDDLAETAIGDLRLLRRIGHGGMGVVYEAVQDPPGRRVALKVLRKDRGDDSFLKRFDLEAQALGRLTHPGVVPLYAYGSFGPGFPFCLMEFVDGKSIVEFAVEKGLDIDGRLRLFRQLCDAMVYAHQKGIIHRDLKPSNVLVTDDGADQTSGRVRVVDFGLARVEEAPTPPVTRTDDGLLLGTLAYMSPEQITDGIRAVDQQSEVYSLGLILFELLTNRRPEEHDDPLAASLTRINEAAPPRPTAIDPTIDADLDTIVTKALARDPGERYAGVAALLEDVRRYLDGEPILAHPQATLYQLRKLVARHRAFVATTSLLLLVIVGGAIGFGLYQSEMADRMRQQRDEVTRRRAVAESVVAFLQEILALAQPGKLGKDAKLMTAVLHASKRVGDAYAELPEVEIEVRSSIAITLCELGQPYWGLHHFERAHTLCREHYGDEHEQTLTAKANLALGTRQAGIDDMAETLMREALDGRIRLLGGRHQDVARSRAQLSQLLTARGEYDEAERLATAAVVACAGRAADEPILAAHAQGSLAQVLGATGRLEAAQQHYEAAYDICRSYLGEDNPETISVKGELVGVLITRRDFSEAHRLNEELLRDGLETLGDEHPEPTYAIENFGQYSLDAGRPRAAEAAFRRVLKLREQTMRSGHIDLLIAKSNLAVALTALDQLDEAETLLREVVDRLAPRLDAEEPDAYVPLASLAVVLFNQGRFAESAELWERVVDVRLRRLGEEHPGALLSLNQYGGVLTRLGEYEEAERLMRHALDGYRRLAEPPLDDRLICQLNLAIHLVAVGRLDEAERLIDEAEEIASAALRDDHPRLLHVRDTRSRLLVAQDRFEEALPLAESAVAQNVATLGESHQNTAGARTHLCAVLRGLKQYERSEEVALEALQARGDAAGDNDPVTRSARHAIALALIGQGRHEEAEPLLVKLLEQSEDLDAGNPDGHWYALSYGECLIGLGRTEEAAEHLRGAQRGLLALVG